MAVRRNAAGSAQSAGRRVALRELQLAASGGASGRVPGAVCDLSRNEPGAPVRGLLHVLELRRGFARYVNRRTQTFRNNRRPHRVAWRWPEDEMAVSAMAAGPRYGRAPLHSEVQLDRLRRRLQRFFGCGLAPWPVRTTAPMSALAGIPPASVAPGAPFRHVSVAVAGDLRAAAGSVAALRRRLAPRFVAVFHRSRHTPVRGRARGPQCPCHRTRSRGQPAGPRRRVP